VHVHTLAVALGDEAALPRDHEGLPPLTDPFHPTGGQVFPKACPACFNVVGRNPLQFNVANEGWSLGAPGTQVLFTGADCNARTRARPSADALQGHREEESPVDEFDRDRTGHCRRHDTRGLLSPIRQPAAGGRLSRSCNESSRQRRRGAIPGDLASRARPSRGTIIQAAWLWLKHQPKSAITRWFVQRTAGQSGHIRRIMIVAVARKLAIALWRFLEQGLVPQGAMLANR
jgi:hypothetical protein